MFWSFMLLGSASLSDCPPPRMGALYGPMAIGTFSAEVCFRRTPQLIPARMIIA